MQGWQDERINRKKRNLVREDQGAKGERVLFQETATQLHHSHGVRSKESQLERQKPRQKQKIYRIYKILKSWLKVSQAKTRQKAPCVYLGAGGTQSLKENNKKIHKTNTISSKIMIPACFTISFKNFSYHRFYFSKTIISEKSPTIQKT